MKVTFWSGVRKSGGVTGNLAAVSIILAFHYKCNVVLSSNHLSNRMLQDCFSGNMAKDRTGRRQYYLSHGEPDYFRKLWEMKMEQNENIIEVPMDGIRIVRPPDATDNSVFYYETPPDVLYLLDAAGESNMASSSALEEADIVAVFLPQNATEIQKFFERYSSLIPKSLFFINDFRKDGDCIPRTLAIKYGLDRKCIGVIPHCNDYALACDEGTLEYFLKVNLDCSTRNPNFYFMKNIKRAAKMVYKHFVWKNLGQKGEKENKYEQYLQEKELEEDGNWYDYLSDTDWNDNNGI